MKHAEGRFSDKDLCLSPNPQSPTRRSSRDPIKHCDLLYFVASWSVSEECWGEVAFLEQRTHQSTMCASMHGRVQIRTAKNKKTLCTLHQFPSFLWFFSPAPYSVALKHARRCVSPRCMYSSCVRGNIMMNSFP